MLKHITFLSFLQLLFNIITLEIQYFIESILLKLIFKIICLQMLPLQIFIFIINVRYIINNKNSLIQNERYGKIKKKWKATKKEFLDLRIVFSLATIQIEKYIRRIFFIFLALAVQRPDLRRELNDIMVRH